ncbi:hypothetical protein [Haloprofundus salilacus]|uniref:hypothetical protein n=1 Tax=Haloprofundus salilacus TaxID=2876190 RepID=UPI001CCE855C|nr:hypothetical protein [Haloprofundus salilacus]
MYYAYKYRLKPSNSHRKEIEELADATAVELTQETNATVTKRNALAETMSDVSEFF